MSAFPVTPSHPSHPHTFPLPTPSHLPTPHTFTPSHPTNHHSFTPSHSIAVLHSITVSCSHTLTPSHSHTFTPSHPHSSHRLGDYLYVHECLKLSHEVRLVLVERASIRTNFARVCHARVYDMYVHVCTSTCTCMHVHMYVHICVFSQCVCCLMIECKRLSDVMTKCEMREY